MLKVKKLSTYRIETVHMKIIRMSNFFNIFFYRRMIALQKCVVFCQAST